MNDTTPTNAEFERNDQMYEFDDSERREVEEKYGLDFTTGREVDAPGEAEIDTPNADEIADGAADESVDTENTEQGYATDGGAAAQTAETTSTGPDVKTATPSKPDAGRVVRSGRTAGQLMELMEGESGAFSFLMHFCMKERAGERPRRRLLAAVVGMDGPGYSELSETIGRSERQVKNYVSALRDAGVVVTQGRGSPSTHVVFPNQDMEVLAKQALEFTADSDLEGE